VEAGKEVASALIRKRSTSFHRQLRYRAREFTVLILFFENAFNAISQAALWRVMRIFKIPDVDLLEQIYEGATVRLAPQ